MNDSEVMERFSRIADRILPHVGMLIMLPRRGARPDDVMYNGTASFVNTGQAKLLVTSAHVIGKFTELRQDRPEMVLAVTGKGMARPVDVSDFEVVENGGKQFDVVTLKLPDPARIASIGKSYFRAEQWPPQPAVKGQVAAMVGFPGIHREASARGLEVRATTICHPITSVSDRNIFLVDENLERVLVKHNPELKDFGSLGGISGTAVYVNDETRHTPMLVGFIYEAGKGTHATILIAHAGYIRADGTFDRILMPR